MLFVCVIVTARSGIPNLTAILVLHPVRRQSNRSFDVVHSLAVTTQSKVHPRNNPHLCFIRLEDIWKDQSDMFLSLLWPPEAGSAWIINAKFVIGILKLTLEIEIGKFGSYSSKSIDCSHFGQNLPNSRNRFDLCPISARTTWSEPIGHTPPLFMLDFGQSLSS